MDLITWASHTFDALDPTSAVAGGIGVPSLAFIAWRSFGKSVVDALTHRWKRTADVELEDAQRESTGVHALADSLKSHQELVRGLMAQASEDRKHFDAELRKVTGVTDELREQLESQTELNANLAAELATTRRYVTELQAANESLQKQQTGMRATIVQLEGEIAKYRDRVKLLEATLALLPADARARLEEEAKGRVDLRDRIKSDPPPRTNFANPRPPKVIR